MLKAVLGSAELLVRVGPTCASAAATCSAPASCTLGAEAPPPGAPIVRVIVQGALGSVEVRSEPRLTDRIKAEVKKLAERWMTAPSMPRPPRAPRPPKPPRPPA